MMKTFKIVFSTSVLSLALLATPAFAVGKPSSLPPQAYGNVSSTPRPTPTPAASRLSAAKLQACQAREEAVKQRMSSLLALVSNMEVKFDAISQRVQDYYTNTVVPSGVTVKNYDALVATIQTRKTAVQAAVTLAQTHASDFNCATGDPGKLFTQFRLDMQAVKKGLQSYRTAIKDLIVAIHSVTKTEESATPSASSKPVEAE